MKLIKIQKMLILLTFLTKKPKLIIKMINCVRLKSNFVLEIRLIVLEK